VTVQTRALFLINCGAMVDLGQLLELNDTNIQVFVLDSHRPYNLRNIYHKQVDILQSLRSRAHVHLMMLMVTKLITCRT
jgi:hypothetical protein